MKYFKPGLMFRNKKRPAQVGRPKGKISIKINVFYIVTGAMATGIF
jgi:hypothetical protein